MIPEPRSNGLLSDFQRADFDVHMRSPVWESSLSAVFQGASKYHFKRLGGEKRARTALALAHLYSILKMVGDLPHLLNAPILEALPGRRFERSKRFK